MRQKTGLKRSQFTVHGDFKSDVPDVTCGLQVGEIPNIFIPFEINSYLRYRVKFISGSTMCNV